MCCMYTVLFSVELNFLIPAALFNDLALLTCIYCVSRNGTENFRRLPYSHCFLHIWHLYLRSRLLLLAYCCQVCCYRGTVPQCRAVQSGTTTVKSFVESTATSILCHDVVQSGTTTGRVCCGVYCYRRTVSWCSAVRHHHRSSLLWSLLLPAKVKCGGA